MAKNKKKTNNAKKLPQPNPQPKKKAQGKSKKNKKSQSRGGRDPTLMRYLCGLTDPFCEHASVARIPDMSSAPSFTYTLNQVVNVVSDAQGRAVWNIGANMNYPASYANMDVNGVIESWTAVAGTSQWTNLGGEGSAYRIVSWGAHFMTTQAPLTAAGVITAGSIQYEAAVITNSNQSGFSNDVILAPVANASLVAIGQPIDMDATMYVPMTTMINDDFTQLVFMFNGCAASTTIGQFFLVYRLEVRPQANTVSARLARTAEPNIPTAMVAASRIRDSLPSIVSEAREGFSALVEEEAYKAAQAAGSGLRGVIMSALGV